MCFVRADRKQPKVAVCPYSLSEKPQLELRQINAFLPIFNLPSLSMYIDFMIITV
jgi:hypothetical protein